MSEVTDSLQHTTSTLFSCVAHSLEHVRPTCQPFCAIYPDGTLESNACTNREQSMNSEEYHRKYHRHNDFLHCKRCSTGREKCKDKVGYDTRDKALRVSTNVLVNANRLLSPYECPWCQRWHTTKTRRLSALRDLPELPRIYRDLIDYYKDTPDHCLVWGVYGEPPGVILRAPSGRRPGVSTGPLVAQVQIALGVAVSGWYDPETRLAVALFQQAEGIVSSGVVDEGTWRALASLGGRS